MGRAELNLRRRTAPPLGIHLDHLIEKVFSIPDVCVSGQLGKDDEMGKDVMHRIWEGLRETHRVRCVK